jgi:hypothetical protein
MNNRSHEPSRIQVLETFAVFSAAALLAAIISHQRAYLFLSLALLCTALVLKTPAALLTRLWLKLSTLLSCLSNGVILTVVFYLVLTPIALVYRLFNRDPLNLGRKVAGSFYSERNHCYSKTDLEKMW